MDGLNRKDEIVDRLKKVSPLFLITVIIPTTIAIVYFGAIASPVFISESRFVVRTAEKQQVPSLGSLFKGSISIGGSPELYTVKDYITSRDALASIDRDGLFRRAYTRDDISIFNRLGGLNLDFGTSETFEGMYKYYGSRISVEQDTASAITTLRVQAYDASDATKLNERLLQLSEALVNRLNDRSRRDTVEMAFREQRAAAVRAREAAVALAVYRNSRNVLDPEKQAAAQLTLSAQIQGQLVAARARLAQLSAAAPKSPEIANLRQLIARLSQEGAAQVQQIAGGNRSLANTAADYQRVYLNSQFADRELAAAMAALQDARNEAQRKRVYIERIVQPNRPDKALEPRRIHSIIATFALGLVAWGILSMLLAGLREHRD